MKTFIGNLGIGFLVIAVIMYSLNTICFIVGFIGVIILPIRPTNKIILILVLILLETLLCKNSLINIPKEIYREYREKHSSNK